MIDIFRIIDNRETLAFRVSDEGARMVGEIMGREEVKLPGDHLFPKGIWSISRIMARW